MIAADTYAQLAGRFVVHVRSIDGALATVRPLGRLRLMRVPVVSLRTAHNPLGPERRARPSAGVRPDDGRRLGALLGVRARRRAILTVIAAAGKEGATRVAIRNAGAQMRDRDLTRLRDLGMIESTREIPEGEWRIYLRWLAWRVTPRGLEALAESDQEPAPSRSSRRLETA